MRNYKDRIAERRKTFVSQLLARTEGRILEAEAQDIAKNYYMPFNNIHDPSPKTVDMVINTDLRDFTSAATFKRVSFDSDFGISNTIEETGEWLIGQGEFGVWFDGDMRGRSKVYTMPKFNFWETQVIMVKRNTSHTKYMENLYVEDLCSLNIWFPLKALITEQ